MGIPLIPRDAVAGFHQRSRQIRHPAGEVVGAAYRGAIKADFGKTARGGGVSGTTTE
jgi:hypothetical protein